MTKPCRLSLIYRRSPSRLCRLGIELGSESLLLSAGSSYDSDFSDSTRPETRGTRF